VRILFTFAGGSGHFDPLVPIAHAAVAAGHIVAFTGEPAMAPTVEAAGFTVFRTGPNTSSTQRRPLLELDAEREDRALRDGYAGRTARGRAAGVLALCAEWRPDLLVCDEVDFGSMVAGERLGLPYASVLVIAAGSFVRKELVAQPLNEVRAEHGLPPDPDLAMLSRYLVLSPFPASFRDPAFPLPATAHSFRPFAPGPAADDTAPLWGTGLYGAPTVYFTLGTVFNMESGDLFSRVLAGLRDLPINLIVTVGRHIAAAEFGSQPANVHIERYIPQSLVMPYCDLVVCHGGSGSVGGALAHGLPLVLIPMGADQPLNAARCAELGVARVLDPVAATAESVREAVTIVLADPTYRRAAEGMRDEMAGLPGPEHVIRLLERLAACDRETTLPSR
jgi:UDP:flavonoid glycosyltransferase YjiC (YdhE family)